MKHLIVTRVRSADPHVTLYSSLCITKGMQTNLKNKEIGSVSGKTASPMSLLSCSPFFLAEFPSGAWVLAMSTYLSQLSSPHEKEPKEGHLLIFKWCQWPNVDGTNSLSWNFIGIPHKPSYSASFSLLIFSGRIPIWYRGTHQAY